MYKLIISLFKNMFHSQNILTENNLFAKYFKFKNIFRKIRPNAILNEKFHNKILMKK